MNAKEVLDAGIEIRIVSGEGTVGSSDVYTGKRTVRAIKSRLTRERCNGDRWARAEALVHPETDDYPAVYSEITL
mgnify:CR=1 FL=1